MTENDEYVIMPQNDFQQIEQIVREYESEPAKGLTHGIQKDAIQNGIGARLQGRSEPNSYRDWMFVFELLKILLSRLLQIVSFLFPPLVFLNLL